jgi:hypothetical protein
MRRVWVCAALATACSGKAVIDGSGEGPDCPAIEREYQAALAEAKRCDPNDENACTEDVSASLSPCSACITWADASNADALERIIEIIDENARSGCASVMVECGDMGCSDAPTAACSDDGVCTDMR